MDDPVFFIDRIPEGTAFGSFNASAAVNAQIDHYRSFFHGLDHFFGDIVPWAKIFKLNCANKNISRFQCFLQDLGVQDRCLKPLTHEILKSSQVMERFVEYPDLRSESDSCTGCIFACRICTYDNHLGRSHTCYTAQQDTLSRHGGCSGSRKR